MPAQNTRTPLIAGNWKMNLDHQQAVSFVQKLAWTLDDAKHDMSKVEVVVLPPFTDIRGVQTVIQGDNLELGYGAQDVSPHEEGPYTGEVAARMLMKLGCTYVVVGHSERRQYHGEDDPLVAAKARAALAQGLVPIVCVGEGQDVRGDGRHTEYCVSQVDGALKGLTPGAAATLVVAYEPVWAIGTGQVATPEDAQEVCAVIRMRLGEVFDEDVAAQVRILYGGSVKPSNIAALMAQPDVDGALVGGASLVPGDFAAICRYQDHQVGV